MTEHLLRVRRLYKRDKNARAVIDSLATRPPERETDVNTIARAAGVEHLEVVRLLKYLGDKAGCGKFVVGRHGNASRMRWDVDPRRLRAVASEELDELPALKREPNVALEIRTTPTARRTPERTATTEELLTYQFPLRPGHTVAFQLPRSLTQSEAARLAKFIVSLAID